MLQGLSLPIVMATENINLFIGLPLNILVLFRLIRTGGLDMIFTLSQILTEILFAMPAPLYFLCYVNVETLCFSNLITFITSTSLSSRFLFQVCVSFERYMAVIHPVTFRKYKATKYRRMVAVFVWIHSIVSGVVAVLFFAELPSDVMGITNALLLGVMLFFSLSLLYGLRKHGPGARERDDGRLSAAKSKAFNVVSISLLLCLIQMTPITVSFGMLKNRTAIETNWSLDMKDSQSLTALSVIMICNQVISLVFGLPLNCYVLFLMFTRGAGRDMDMTFTVSQSAAEILLSFLAPLSITCHVDADLCAAKALGFFWGFSISARCYFQCCVCLERYVAVVHPITFLKYNHLRYRLICAMVCWMNSLLCAVYCVFSFPQLPFRTLAFMHILIFILDLFCFLMILRALRRPELAVRGRGQAGGNAIKKRAFNIVFVNLMVFLMQVTPLLCLFIMKQNISLEAFNLAVAVSMSVNFTAGFVHPIFFLHKSGKF
ncbi:P2Y purinoceptor 6 [Bagarius yarrelli]|uniref:P2Y purinoceptor 6 n=1 Tax=Bagarius yarrelli TaxID=175774 RepID=A0A556VUR5_BAGYA|nr:P2Y purinoceptor 6 [Bagarius yarrelli]